MVDDNILNRMNKLRELAKRGSAGEKDNADALLKKFMDKYGITEEDLSYEFEEPRYHLFSYSNLFERKLLVNCILKCTNDVNTPLYHSRNTRMKIGVYCTNSQLLEIELEYEFHLRFLTRELELFTQAYIQKNDIYPDNIKVSYVDSDDKDSMRMLNYTTFIDKNKRSLLIGDGK